MCVVMSPRPSSSLFALVDRMAHGDDKQTYSYYYLLL